MTKIETGDRVALTDEAVRAKIRSMGNDPETTTLHMDMVRGEVAALGIDPLSDYLDGATVGVLLDSGERGIYTLDMLRVTSRLNGVAMWADGQRKVVSGNTSCSWKSVPVEANQLGATWLAERLFFDLAKYQDQHSLSVRRIRDMIGKHAPVEVQQGDAWLARMRDTGNEEFVVFSRRLSDGRIVGRGVARNDDGEVGQPLTDWLDVETVQQVAYLVKRIYPD